jgi:hypothetical protein
MPSFSSKSQLTPAVSSSGLVPFADVDLIRGAFKVYESLSVLRNEQTAFFVDAQIVYVSSSDKLYQCSYETADNIFVFEDSMSFSEFTFAGGGAASIPDGTISGSQQISDLGFITNDQTSSFVLVDNSSSFFQSMSFDDSTNLLSIEGGNTIDLSPLTGSGGGSGTGIFALTGSIYSTTNNIQVTGSFEVGGGLFKLTEYTTLPSVEAGAIAYSGSNFYFGIGDV